MAEINDDNEIDVPPAAHDDVSLDENDNAWDDFDSDVGSDYGEDALYATLRGSIGNLMDKAHKLKAENQQLKENNQQLQEDKQQLQEQVLQLQLALAREVVQHSNASTATAMTSGDV